MRIPKLILLYFIIFSCKENKVKTKVELPVEIQKTEVIDAESDSDSDSIYERYKLGQVETYDWNLISDRAVKYGSVSKQFSDKDSIPKDFLEFSKKFISNVSFQEKHIDFDNLIAVDNGCDETFVMSKKNWVFDNWDFINFIRIDDEVENTFNFSDSIFYCEYVIKEVGTFRILGFEKKDDEWYLTLYHVNDC
ncbi:hypothetical protein [uncultured Algibacter sp.]|uniref:hypothetical protein n=1 Tax=uncultured Algibacter sp. TaxID=298659 RepID=UPI00262F2337|nr:hypothetical protein [uncultured Algibacter sp.]